MMNLKLNQKDKIPVLHIITRLIPGGADENTIYTVTGLDRAGFRVDLMVGREYESGFADIDINGFLVNKALIRAVDPLRDMVAFVRMVRIIKKNRYAIVHTHTAKAGIIGRFAARCAGVPVILHTLHGSTFHNHMHPFTALFYRLLERIAEKTSSKTITVGDDLRDRYLAAKIGRRQNYITIRSGFDLHRFKQSANHGIRKELGIPAHHTVIGTVARLEPRKGVHYFVSMAERLIREKKDVEFVIAGDGPEYDNLCRLIEAKKLQNSVTLLGYREDIEKVLLSIDLFVLTSLWEGLPRVLVQAALSGKPIVCFDVEGAGEIVKNGKNGYIVETGDSDALINNVKELLENRTRMNEMAAYSKQFDAQPWSREIMVSQIEKLYLYLLQTKNQ